MEVTEELKSLAEIFKKNGHTLYVVGGSVRDSLLGLKAKNIDYDLCSNVSPRKLIDIIDGTQFTLKNVNGKIGVMSIIGEKTYEYVTFRKDVYDGESHYPVEVRFVHTLEEDSKRRDFKINAIYYDILEDKIIDPLGGINDINNKVITTTRNPKIVYEDDPERILRALRLHILFDLKISDSDKEIIKSNIENIDYLSKKRIRKEFEKMIVLDKLYENYDMGKFAHFRMFQLIGKLGLWKYFLPEMEEIQHSTEVNENGERYYSYILNELKLISKKIRIYNLIENMAKAKFAKLPPKTESFEKVLDDTIEKNLGEDGLNFLEKEKEDIKRVILGSKFKINLFVTKNKIRSFIFDNRFEFDEIIKLKENLKSTNEKVLKENSKTIEKLKLEYNQIKEEKYPFYNSDLDIGGEELIRSFPKIKLERLDDLREGILKRLIVYKKKNIKEELIALGAKEIESNKEFYLE